MSINSFGIGGSNVHVLLRSPDSVASTRTANAATTATRLATCAARTKEGVEAILAEMMSRPGDVDMQYLLQSSSGNLSPITHPYRGAALLNTTDSQHTVQVLQPGRVEISGNVFFNPIPYHCQRFIPIPNPRFSQFYSHSLPIPIGYSHFLPLPFPFGLTCSASSLRLCC